MVPARSVLCCHFPLYSFILLPAPLCVASPGLALHPLLWLSSLPQRVSVGEQEESRDWEASQRSHFSAGFWLLCTPHENHKGWGRGEPSRSSLQHLWGTPTLLCEWGLPRSTFRPAAVVQGEQQGLQVCGSGNHSLAGKGQVPSPLQASAPFRELAEPGDGWRLGLSVQLSGSKSYDYCITC